MTATNSAINLLPQYTPHNYSHKEMNDLTATQNPINLFSHCALCQRKIHHQANTHHNDICLCDACHKHMVNLPETVARSVKRHLMGNVL